MICTEENTHHPYGFPWSIHVRCEETEPGHTVHRGHDFGYTVMWITASSPAGD